MAWMISSNAFCLTGKYVLSMTVNSPSNSLRRRLVALPNGPNLVVDVIDARDTLLGDPLERGPDAAVWNNITKQYEGGIAFERTGNAHPVGQSRAYTLGLSYEQPTQLLAPSVGNKGSPEVTTNPGLDMRRKATRVCTFVHVRSAVLIPLQAGIALAVAACAYLPAPHRAHLKTQADLVNAPRLGTIDNDSFFNVQANISHALDGDDST